jgi:hypothetical protein
MVVKMVVKRIAELSESNARTKMSFVMSVRWSSFKRRRDPEAPPIGQGAATGSRSGHICWQCSTTYSPSVSACLNLTCPDLRRAGTP